MRRRLESALEGVGTAVMSLGLLLAPIAPTTACVAGSDEPAAADGVAAAPGAAGSASESAAGLRTGIQDNGVQAAIDRERRTLLDQLRREGIEDEAVLAALDRVPRHRFVPEEYRSYAYDNRPLPIGHDQTISQPFVVARMTELLDVSEGHRVLEIGTGSGYQAAVLSPLVEKVYTMEIIPELAEEAKGRLERLDYDNVEVRNGDGYYGWEEHAPFQAIIVTAAPDHVPQPLVRQLAEGGRMVIPVGQVGAYQTLWKIVKQDGELVSSNHGAVVFVPLTGEH